MLNGKKTYLGAAITAFSAIGPLLGLSAEVTHAIQVIGEAIIATGLGHKLQKATTKG